MDIEPAKAPEAQATEPPRERVRGLTIDSAYSLDLDDAFWVVKTDTGYAVDISIADVSFTIPKGSALDLQAAEKVETLYFRNSNEPMIPRSLAENALSLLPKQERNTISIRLTLDHAAEVLSASFHETTIKSLFKFSHRRVDEELINPSGSFHRMLSVIQELSTKLYEKRRAKGACAFYDIESKLYADEDGAIRKYDGDFFHAQMIVQELMILANEQAARLMGESNYPAIYRNHKTKTWTPERTAVMDQINGALIHTEQLAALRAKMALWFEKAEYNSKVEGHYGLNVPAYTHFSSPIRRYADLINHRVIRAIIRKEPAPYTVEEIEAEAKRINAWKIKIDEERSAKFKEQSRAEDRLLMTDRSKYLKGLKPSDFSRVFKQAIRENVLNDATKEAVMARMMTGALEPADVYQLVFKASEVFADLQSALFKLFEHKPQYSIMALEMARMNDGQQYSFRTEEHEGHFYALVDVQSKTTQDAAWATNKKSAQSKAAIAWIKAFFRKELVPSETVGIQPIVRPKPEVAKAAPTTNYVGWIMEWCQAKKNPPPTFEYSGEGPAHMPVFKCTATLTTPRGSISADGTSTSKQTAKAEACQKIYEAMKK